MREGLTTTVAVHSEGIEQGSVHHIGMDEQSSGDCCTLRVERNRGELRNRELGRGSRGQKHWLSARPLRMTQHAIMDR